MYSLYHPTKSSQAAAFCPSPSRFESVIYIYHVARTPNQSRPSRPSVLCCPKRVASSVRIHVPYPYPYPYPYPCPMSYPFPRCHVRIKCHIRVSYRSKIVHIQSAINAMLSPPTLNAQQSTLNTPILQTQPIRTKPIQTPIASHNTQPKESLLSSSRPSANVPLLSPSTANLPKPPSTFTFTLTSPPPRRCRVGHGRHIPRARARGA